MLPRKHFLSGRKILAFVLFTAVYCCIGFPTPTANAAQPPSQDPVRWTTSKIKGTPDPPSPYSIERVLPDVKLTRPTEMIYLRSIDQWVATQVNGKVVSFAPTGGEVRTVLDLKKPDVKHCRALGIAFDPDFPQRPYCYIAKSEHPGRSDGASLIRLTVTDPQTLEIDPESEVTLLRWSSVDHSGGCVKFGPDGYLYLPIGDGQRPTPPDPKGTGQDISDLQASIVRIDVNDSTWSKEQRAESNLPYRIPADNPFVGVENARGELWAFGVRNPWKMCFHPESGELWTGDVGWEMMEMVYRIERGGNYGWSVKEGSQDVKPNGNRSKIAITPPIFEHNHIEARSITGGYFWRSQRLAQLHDAYIYGDWMTGKIWGLKHDGQQVTWQQELTDTPLQIVSFALAPDGDVLVVGYDGTIHRLIPNPDIGTSMAADFPQRLSETGLFTDTANQVPSAGVVEYSINAHHWADGTTSQQWVALAEGDPMAQFDRSNWEVGQVAGHFSFPHDTVFAKTVSIQTDPADTSTKKRLETQILHRFKDEFKAYNYIWNAEQTDAVLQPNQPVYTELEVKDPIAKLTGGRRTQIWTHASRDQCALCHIWSAGTVHGFKTDQLNRSHEGETENQLDKFFAMGLLDQLPEKTGPATSPTDTVATLEARAREYLSLNCAHCHRNGGGGTAAIALNKSVALNDMRMIDQPAAQGGFGIANPHIISSGAPGRSALLYRLAKTGPGRMPHFGTNVIDQQGVQMLSDWIASLEPTSNQSTVVDSSVEMIDRLIAAARSDIDDDVVDNLLDQLLSKTETALILAIRCGSRDAGGIDENLLTLTCNKAAEAKPEIRDLFERYFPAELKIERLGPNVNPTALLAKASRDGDVERGRKLFFESTLNCRQCHQSGGQGIAVGPTFDGIGSLRTMEQLLESIRKPSALIDQKYLSYLVLTDEGEVITGVKTSETSDSVTIVDSHGKPHEILNDAIEAIQPTEKSVMPEGLLDELTLEQAADLLAWLSSQHIAKKIEK